MTTRGKTTELAATPADLVRLLGERVSAGEVEGALELYDDEATVSTQPGSVVSGAAAIQETLAGLTAMQPRLVGTIAWLQEAGSIALLINDWTIDGRQPSGEPMHMEGRGADVLRRGSDGGWRFLVDCPWALDAPPAVPDRQDDPQPTRQASERRSA